MKTSVLSDRVLGQYPISIATSLAIEGAMGIHPDKPDQTKKLLPGYAVIWVNLKTIFRNLYYSVDKEQLQNASVQDFIDAFTSEIDQLKHVISVETASRTDVVLYVSDYAGMGQKYKHAILRGDITANQLAYTAMMVETLSAYIRAHPNTVKRYTLKILDVEARKALMLTHFAYDLLAKGFSNLHLLESHTGTIKNKFMWYTKYLNGKELSSIPFREDMLQIFGDNEHFRPWPIKARRQVLDLAAKYNWSQVTQNEKVRYGFGQIVDPYLRDILREL